MEFPSKLLENLVYNISQLSGIGKGDCPNPNLKTSLPSSIILFETSFICNVLDGCIF